MKKKMYGFVVAVSMLMTISCFAQESFFPLSEDGRYKATRVYKNGVHFEITEAKENGKRMLTTHAKYPGNDVKAGAFGMINDTQCFVALYHYGHTHSTWAGRWEILTGKELPPKECSGYVRDVSWAFE